MANWIRFGIHFGIPLLFALNIHAVYTDCAVNLHLNINITNIIVYIDVFYDCYIQTNNDILRIQIMYGSVNKSYIYTYHTHTKIHIYKSVIFKHTNATSHMLLSIAKPRTWGPAECFEILQKNSKNQENLRLVGPQISQ